MNVMKKGKYQTPTIFRSCAFNSKPKVANPSLAFEQQVLGELRKTINLIVSRNQINDRTSGDYQTTFSLSKTRLKRLLKSGQIFLQTSKPIQLLQNNLNAISTASS